MNPLTNMKNVLKLSEKELGSDGKTSWHDMYKDSAWIFVGGLPYDLTEGDIVCVFSQYGEIVNINLVRDKITGKQKGFCFICYEDQRSTILAVDNLNGIKILNRTIRVDHVAEYKVPKENEHTDEETRQLIMEGCAPKPQIPSERIKQEMKTVESYDQISLPPRLPIGSIKSESKVEKEEKVKSKKIKKEKKVKKEKKKKEKNSRKKRKQNSSSNSSSEASDNESLSRSKSAKKRRSRSRSRSNDRYFRDKSRNRRSRS